MAGRPVRRAPVVAPEVVSCLSLALLPEGRRRAKNKLDAWAAAMAFFFTDVTERAYCAFGLCTPFH